MARKKIERNPKDLFSIIVFTNKAEQLPNGKYCLFCNKVGLDNKITDEKIAIVVDGSPGKELPEKKFFFNPRRIDIGDYDEEVFEEEKDHYEGTIVGNFIMAHGLLPHESVKDEKGETYKAVKADKFLSRIAGKARFLRYGLLQNVRAKAVSWQKRDGADFVRKINFDAVDFRLARRIIGIKNDAAKIKNYLSQLYDFMNNTYIDNANYNRNYIAMTFYHKGKRIGVEWTSQDGEDLYGDYPRKVYFCKKNDEDNYVLKSKDEFINNNFTVIQYMLDTFGEDLDMMLIPVYVIGEDKNCKGRYRNLPEKLLDDFCDNYYDLNIKTGRNKRYKEIQKVTLEKKPSPFKVFANSQQENPFMSRAEMEELKNAKPVKSIEPQQVF